MNKVVKTIGIFFFITIGILACIYLLIKDFGRKNPLSNEPQNPRIEVPVTYTLDWWPYQHNLIIDSLKIDIIESNLHLFNSKSLVSNSVYGKMKYDSSWEPKVEIIHITERFGKDSLKNRIIEITPIISVSRNEYLDSGEKEFNFKNEHIISSSNWGVNKTTFVCGDIEQIITVRQRK